MYLKDEILRFAQNDKQSKGIYDAQHWIPYEFTSLNLYILHLKICSRKHIILDTTR